MLLPIPGSMPITSRRHHTNHGPPPALTGSSALAPAKRCPDPLVQRSLAAIPGAQPNRVWPCGHTLGKGRQPQPEDNLDRNRDFENSYQYLSYLGLS
jgi:hypothetical protein